MGFLSKFEGRMEDTLEGAADKMFDAPISPVQIAKKAEKKMRREKMVGAGKQYAPTLYTILVNPDDDRRLFGYYPTLAGETETYLAAKAADEGLVMDGQPLVRFIVDEDLKHGKFDVIAEAVAAPIIAQLRAEEMQRYGIAPSSSAAPYGAPPGYGAAPSAPVQPYGYGQPSPAPEYGAAAPAYGDIDAGFDDFGSPSAAPGAPDAHEFPSSDADNRKPPLPYVPEDEIDYSLDYGEYTFDSQDFDDYHENGPAQGSPVSPAPSAGAVGAAAGYAGMAGGAAGTPNVGRATDTVVFAAGSQAANPVPDQAAVRARLIDTTNNRTYNLATARLLLGRESKNDIVVNDINASRTHAELRLEPQGVWTITDLGSTNGTLVNGGEIATHPLREGDRITIGVTNFLFTQA